MCDALVLGYLLTLHRLALSEFRCMLDLCCTYTTPPRLQICSTFLTFY